MNPLTLQKSMLLGMLLSACAPLCAQKNTAYAITGTSKDNVSWTVIREIDLSTGKELRTIYEPKNNIAIVDAASGNRLQVNNDGNLIVPEVQNSNSSVVNDLVTAPTETMVAASAFDAKTNRLFFTPMHSNELRYFDFASGTNQVYYVRNNALKSFINTDADATVITRMCFGADGYGYALTNDGSHLIRFSSGKSTNIVDLGAIQDDRKNTSISIQNKCTSWGGDMIADAFGNLYIISMRGNIFKFNPSAMMASFMGQIKNIPQDYLINAAAVDAEGNVIIGSATKSDHYYSVNLSTLQAAPLANQVESVYNASDLASGHFAFEQLVSSKNETTAKASINVYPNPVVNKTISLSFDKMQPGYKTILLLNAAGTVVFNKNMATNATGNVQVALPANMAKGFYVLSLTSAAGKEQYTKKIIIE